MHCPQNTAGIIQSLKPQALGTARQAHAELTLLLPRLPSQVHLSFLFFTSSRNSIVSRTGKRGTGASPKTNSTLRGPSPMPAHFFAFLCLLESVLLGYHKENQAGRMVKRLSSQHYIGRPCLKQKQTEKETGLKTNGSPNSFSSRSLAPSQILAHPFMSMCICVWAYGDQRRMSGVQLCCSLSHSLETGSLTEPGVRLAVSTPQSSCVTILAFQVGNGDVST